MASKQFDWDEVYLKLMKGKRKSRRVRLGSPGSAQVTRCRLLETYHGIEARTEGNLLIITRA